MWVTQERGVQVGDIIGVIYFVGCFLSLFVITRAFATEFGKDTADTESIMIGLMMAFCLCWFWPLGIVGVPVYYAVKHW